MPVFKVKSTLQGPEQEQPAILKDKARSWLDNKIGLEDIGRVGHRVRWCRDLGECKPS